VILQWTLIAPVWAAPSVDTAHAVPSMAQLIFPFINFVIFLYLVRRFLLPKAREYFRSRRDEIKDAVQGASESIRDAEQRVQDLRNRLSLLSEEAKNIEEELRREGERQKSKLLVETEHLANKIKLDAGFLADQEAKLARRTVRQEIARRARQSAEQALQRHLTPADQQRLVQEFLTDLRQAK
jgi:F-type H+-transporting ATPase subunit b